jgi:hypothetical protein
MFNDSLRRELNKVFGKEDMYSGYIDKHTVAKVLSMKDIQAQEKEEK